MAVYLLDRENGMYTSVGKSLVQLECLIGPFDSIDSALDYLMHMTGATAGTPIPDGYSIISMYQPSEDWKEGRGNEWNFKPVRMPLKDSKKRHAQKKRKRRTS